MSGLKDQRYICCNTSCSKGRDKVVLLAEKVRNGIMDLHIAHIGSPYHFVTVSIGTAAIIPKEESPNYLISVADQALYQSKGSGRNQASIFHH